MSRIANQLQPSNDQADFSGVEDLIIHGPSWVNWMPFDAHARSVVLPYLRGVGWTVRVSQTLRRIDVIAPWWHPEVIQ